MHPFLYTEEKKGRHFSARPPGPRSGLPQGAPVLQRLWERKGRRDLAQPDASSSALAGQGGSWA